ncbi:hypothetical protein, partial [Cytobacillus sp. SAFR-174]|uniref:hypothetical protein n=1 Tax=Cytobacillus sp. SAFR-174 TaxID=3436868 RepID=UPI003F7F02E0
KLQNLLDKSKILLDKFINLLDKTQNMLDKLQNLLDIPPIPCTCPNKFPANLKFRDIPAALSAKK